MQQISSTPPDPQAHCANCDAQLTGEYCHRCGEKRITQQDLSFFKFLEDTFKSFTHLDSKLLRSLMWLVVRPGFLTAQYLQGKRKNYLKPLTLFLIVNALYFVTISFNHLRTYETALQLQYRNSYQQVVVQLVGQRLAGASEAEKAAYEAAFDAQNHTLSKSFLLLMAPLIASAFALLFWRRRMYFGAHLIAALHFVALLLILNMALGICCYGSLSRYAFYLMGIRTNLELMVEFIEPLAWVWLLASITFRNAYGVTWPQAVWRGLVLAFIYTFLLILYRFALFLLTFYSLG
jgi:Protein of unknown function (DUF3667)